MVNAGDSLRLWEFSAKSMFLGWGAVRMGGVISSRTLADDSQ